MSLFSTAARVPGTGVGSRWLECLTPNPHASLFSESMLPRLHIYMSVLTHSDQVFLGLPLLLALGIVILVVEFMHEEERATCPYHLKRLVRREYTYVQFQCLMFLPNQKGQGGALCIKINLHSVLPFFPFNLKCNIIFFRKKCIDLLTPSAGLWVYKWEEYLLVLCFIPICLFVWCLTTHPPLWVISIRIIQIKHEFD